MEQTGTAKKYPARGREELYVFFKASGIPLAVAYGDVREVISFARPVPVPQTPSYVRGVINYCGQVCPVVSIEPLTDSHEAPVSGRTRIIMLELPENSAIRIGMIADRFMGSIKLLQEEISGYEGSIKGFSAGCITGSAHINDVTALIFRPFLLLKGLDYMCLE